MKDEVEKKITTMILVRSFENLSSTKIDIF